MNSVYCKVFAQLADSAVLDFKKVEIDIGGTKFSSSSDVTKISDFNQKIDKVLEVKLEPAFEGKKAIVGFRFANGITFWNVGWAVASMDAIHVAAAQIRDRENAVEMRALKNEILRLRAADLTRTYEKVEYKEIDGVGQLVSTRHEWRGLAQNTVMREVMYQSVSMYLAGHVKSYMNDAIDFLETTNQIIDGAIIYHDTKTDKDILERLVAICTKRGWKLNQN